MDTRLLPSNGRVAASYLEGEIDASRFSDGELMQCCVAMADLLGKPDGKRLAQLLYGDMFNVLEQRDGYCFGQSLFDGYCGYVRDDDLGRPEDATHWVATPATHLYPAPHVKLRATGPLYLGSEVVVTGIEGNWSRLKSGECVPTAHLRPIGDDFDDPVVVAELLLGTPYLWGGSTRYGIDCSGLIQLAWRACGKDCPRDSDMQEDELGADLDLEEIDRGDLVFWKGHVGIMASKNTLLHANAHHMAVAFEPLEEAISRIQNDGGGSVTAIKRTSLTST